jgi:Cys-tRNA(Pro) deacylase
VDVLGSKDVNIALAKLDLDIEIIKFEQSTATSQMAADNVGCELGQIVKSLGFMINKEKPILILTSGDQTVDDRKLSKMFEVGRKKIRMMKVEQCIEILGYAPGGVPPIGHRTTDFQIIIDQMLKRYETVYAAGGSAQTIFPIELETLQNVTQAIFADVVKG